MMIIVRHLFPDVLKINEILLWDGQICIQKFYFSIWFYFREFYLLKYYETGIYIISTRDMDSLSFVAFLGLGIELAA